MHNLAAVASWTGRALALGLFGVWGAFFLEHLGWFLHPDLGVPPVRVWWLQFAHLLMLCGLLAILRWEIAGTVLTILASLVFFAAVAGPRFPLFFLATAAPAVLVLLGRWLRRRRPRDSTT
ncbi:MAG: hypothetical protein ACYC61_27555 [Isosphaeraceae bacterium]